MRKARHLTRVSISLTAVLVVAAMAIPAGATSAARVRLSASAPDRSRASFVRAADPSQTIGVHVYLGWRDPAGAEALLQSVSDPHSPDYANYLTPAEFHSQFSKSDADVAAVESWLREQGLTVGTTPADHLWVPASGSAADLEAAFDVKLGEYKVGDETLRLPDQAPSIPTSLGGIVQGVNGLTEVNYRPASPFPPPPKAFLPAKPCSAYWAQKMAYNKPKAFGTIQPYRPCPYTPSQMQKGYGIDGAIGGGNDGTGVTIGIVDAFASPTIQQDLDQYSADHGLPQADITQFVAPVTPGYSIQPGWWGEQTLDFDAAHSMAPGASLVYMGAGDQQGGLDDALVDAIDNHRADILSNSWGNKSEQTPPPSTIASNNDLFIQAGTEGIGMYFASGDEGDNKATLGYRTVEWPSASPYVTGVGGTSLGLGVDDAYLFETGWGTTNSYLVGHAWQPKPPGSFYYGGTGGTSRMIAEPWYQMGVVPDSLSGYWGGANRVVPDIAMNGDPTTGILVGETQRFPNGSIKYAETAFGGTSLSTPLMAGVMALADQGAGFSHGFANPVFYDVEGTGALHDIVDPGNKIAAVRANYNNGVDASAGKYIVLRPFNQTGTLHTIPGYDDVTGVGTPNGESFLDALSGP